jgi:hypothetical protein
MRTLYSSQQVAVAFDAARKVQSGKVRPKEAADALIRDHAFNRSNAPIIINVIRRIFEGRPFSMPISVDAVAYCIERITREDGESGRQRALAAYLGFIEYDEKGKLKPGSVHRTLYRSLVAQTAAVPAYPTSEGRNT